MSEDRVIESPFAVLGIAPTLDPGVVKRAWFVALQQHPPHSDPTGFRRVRDAYEALTGPGRLELAWSTAPIDLDAALATLNARLEGELAAARVEASRAAAVDGAARRFTETFSRLSLAEALARCSPPIDR
jgi:hypothetical protein